MLEGQYLGAPPVNIGRSVARVTLATMLRGGSSYGQAAGLGPPLAMPPLQPGIVTKRPSSPHADPQIVALYPIGSPALAKLNLRQRFGVGG
jgi:hypothetical protein